MGVEAFAETARLLFPDRAVAAVEDVDFRAPFKFYRHEPRTLEINATFRTDGDDVVADCTLTGERVLPNRPEPEVKTHFTGRVRLSPKAPKAARAGVPGEHQPVVEKEAIYRLYFHGPAYQVMAGAWLAGDEVAGRFAPDLPANHEPAGAATVMEPRLVELCFQTAGIWEMGTRSRMALPLHIDRVTTFRPLADAKGGLTAVIRTNGDEGFSAAVVDDGGRVYVEMSGYRTVEVPAPLDGEAVAPLREAMQP